MAIKLPHITGGLGLALLFGGDGWGALAAGAYCVAVALLLHYAERRQ